MHPSDYLVIATLMIVVEATPSCTVYKYDISNLVCLPGATDYGLTKGLIPESDQITTISLKSCRITSIDCEAFPKINAKILNLSENKIQELPSCAFQNMPQLVSLNLSYNNIIELPPGIIDDNSNIEFFDLKGNNLNTIHASLLDKAHKLKNLDLSNNKIEGKNINPYSFGYKTQIVSLDLSRNDMSTASEDLLKEFQSLQFLYLNRCFLTKVPSFATTVNLKTLKHLYLTTNQIAKLDDPAIFVNLDDLQILNLADNAIESIAENIFAPMRKLKAIVLKHNRLSEIPEKVFQNMPKLVTVDLSYNVLKHFQVTPFRNTPMKNLNVSGNKLSYMPENFYVQLINSGGKLKKFFFSDNPWQCACLRDIIQDVKTYGVDYNSAKYDGIESVCVSDGQFVCRRE